MITAELRMAETVTTHNEIERVRLAGCVVGQGVLYGVVKERVRECVRA